MVPPYFSNFGKRLIKSPKLYWLDSGLACHLLGIETETQLRRSPFAGPLFEGFIASEIIKQQINAGRRREIFYFRDQQGLEVDFGSFTRWPIEPDRGKSHSYRDARDDSFHDPPCFGRPGPRRSKLAGPRWRKCGLRSRSCHAGGDRCIGIAIDRSLGLARPKFVHRPPGLVDGLVRVGTPARIGIGDGHPPAALSADHVRRRPRRDRIE